MGPNDETSEADLYVSPDGSDAWSGALVEPTPDGADGPLATLERARDALRGRGGGGRVLLRGGTYRLAEPLTLGPSDSGVTYAAFPGETPVVSGGRAITGWQPAEGGLWTADLPEVRAGQWHFHQLFVGGERRRRGRYPREGYVKLAGIAQADPDGWAGSSPDEQTEWSKKAFQFEPGDVRSDWHNIEDVEVVVLQYWMAARLRIDTIDEDKRIVSFTGGSFRPLTWSFGYYVDNVFEGLDEAGAWYLDRKAGTLHYHALPGEDMNEVEVIAPVAGQLVRLEGDADSSAFVRDVTLRGIEFSHTRWDLPPEGYYCIQAEITPPAAIQAEGAVGCRIENCRLTHLAAWGIELGRGCQDDAVVGCTIRDVGAGCIKIGEPKNCEKDVQEARGILVADSRLLDGGQICLGPAAVWIGQSSHNTASHNEVSGGFHWAVSVGWNWRYFPLNRARDNIVEFNHIHHLGTEPLGVHGALYCLGISPGTVLRNNHIHHVHCNDHWGAGEGIILDNGCSGILIENNVVHDAVAGGFGCNFNCFGNIVQNNIFAYGTKFQLMRYGDAPPGDPPPNGEVFARNIVVWREGPLIHDKDWWSFETLWNYNLYWREGGEEVRFMSYSFDEWKGKGLDQDSVVADPLFVDAENRDLSLRPESPAFRLGFRPIDISDVGPRR